MTKTQKKQPEWMTSGTPWVWLTAGTVAFSLILVLGVLGLIGYQGVIHFWPSSVVQISLSKDEGGTALGEVAGREVVIAARLQEQGIDVPDGMDFVEGLLLKTGNGKI